MAVGITFVTLSMELRGAGLVEVGVMFRGCAYVRDDIALPLEIYL